MGHGVSEGVCMGDVRWSAGDWPWDGSEPEGKVVEGLLSGATLVRKNDVDGNQFRSVSELRRLRWLCIDLNGKTSFINITWQDV